MKSRREAREWAMKVLYACEVSGATPDPLLKHLLIGRQVEENHLHFCQELMNKTVSRIQQIDEIIRSCAEKWELERIAILDLVILRMSICELLYFPDIPPKVTINEAIEIAKKYSTEKSDKFVNGILDNVFHRIIKGQDLISKEVK
jgi:transcription antitermination protein NusB